MKIISTKTLLFISMAVFLFVFTQCGDDPEPDPKLKTISKECIDLWSAAMKTVKKNKVLTSDEYQELIKKCPDFKLLFFKIVEDNTYKPKTTALGNLETFRKWKKEADEVTKKKQKEEEEARARDQANFDRSHSGKAHTACECWSMTAYGKYKDGTKIKITAKTLATATKLPKPNLTLVAASGKELKGLHQYKENLTCCTFEHFSKYVQVAHALPKGKGKKPVYSGSTHGSDRSFAMGEYDYWITLTSTPNNYGWEFSNGIGKFGVHKKREFEVREVFGNLTPLKSGLGKIEMNINGTNCPTKTLYYEVVSETD